ncbi:hypothetical protein B0A49_07621 [Cryomyces minteri]|uniref:Uncharacterized protein n=1 Tax=Cryomyces minteri TaxID=331657 RepID=A0A4U0WXL7_9PEZI|nr:hypothetical protein B0A49_07621 [Cryomyces minteri]
MLSSRHAPSAALLPLILVVPPHLYLGMTTSISTTSPLSATSSSPLSPSSATHAHPLTLAQDIHGNTPLHHASASGSLKALRVLLSFGANPLAQNALAWTPLDYSQTVAAEVYFRNLVAEFEKRRVENLQKEREERRRLGGGVRLITGDGEEQQQGVEEGERVTRQQQHQQWSPVESRREVTPAAARSEGWGAGAGAGAATAQRPPSLPDIHDRLDSEIPHPQQPSLSRPNRNTTLPSPLTPPPRPAAGQRTPTCPASSTRSAANSPNALRTPHSADQPNAAACNGEYVYTCALSPAASTTRSVRPLTGAPAGSETKAAKAREAEVGGGKGGGMSVVRVKSFARGVGNQMWWKAC